MRWCLPLLFLAGPLAGQSVRPRLEGRVPSAAIPAIDSLVQVAMAESLPADLLVQKALEGGAKGVAPEIIVSAVRVNLDQLRRARYMLVDDGDAPPTTADEVAVLNYALKRGLSPNVVNRMVAALPTQPRSSALHAVADLVAHGFDQDSAANLILSAARLGLQGERLLDVSGRAILELQKGHTYPEALGTVERELPNVPAAPTPPTSPDATRPVQRAPQHGHQQAPQGAPAPPRP